MENSAPTPLLHDLITATSLPLKAVEVDFSVDSTGFTGRSYTPYYDELYRGTKEHNWIKAHLMTGDKTHIVTAVVIKDRDAADAPQLPEVLNITARHFKIAEVSADKAYATVAVHEAIAAAGATAFVPFRSRATTLVVAGVFGERRSIFIIYIVTSSLNITTSGRISSRPTG